MSNIQKFLSQKSQALVALVIGLVFAGGMSVLATTIGSSITSTEAITSGTTMSVGTDLTVTSGARIGTGSTAGHITALGDDSLFVEGQAEFDGTVWFDGSLRASSTLLVTGAMTAYSNLNASSTFAVTDVSNFYGNVNFNGYATTTASNGNFATDGTLGVSSSTPSTTLGVAGSAYVSTGLGVGVVNTTAGRIVASTDLGVASSSPYVALGVTGTTTATAGMVIGSGGSGITQLRFGTCTYNPGVAITANRLLSTNCTGATGVQTFDRVFVTPVGLAEGLVMTSASSTANDIIQVSVLNASSTANITPASATWNWMAIR